MTPRRLLLVVAALAISIGAGRTAGTTFGAFSATTSNPTTMSAKDVFPGTRSWSAWDLRDAADGSEADASDAEAFVGHDDHHRQLGDDLDHDALPHVRHEQPAARGRRHDRRHVQLRLRRQRNNANNEMCFYFEVIRRSTGTVIGTHGSSAAPIACQATTTVIQTSTALPEVTSADIANDLRIRIYGAHTETARAMRVDRAVVSGSTTVAPFTLYETTYTDAADSTPAAVPWPIATADAVARQTSSNWPTAFSTARYLKVTFPAYLPSSATVTSAQLVHTFRPTTSSATACFYFQVLQGTTVIATYGSTTTPFCATGAAYTTNTIPMPALTTAALVNGAIVRMYVRTTNGGSTQHDQFRLDVGYSVD